jgi:two-component system sensor histidine kinase CpxA
MHVYVFDDEGSELRGQEAGRLPREFAARVLAAGEPLSERSGSLHLEGRSVTDSDGSLRAVVGVMKRPPRPIDLLDPGTLMPRLAVLTLVVGLLCLLLARHLSAPVGALRAATRGLAGGDLSVRVAPSVARRRDEIGDLARDFDRMAERLEDQVAAHHRLIRDVSHELRSPLARLEVALALARQRTGEGASELLDRIGRESGRLEQLVAQLLSLERLESGSGSGDPQPVDVVRLVDGVVVDARFEAEAQGCEIRLQGASAPVVSGWLEPLRSAVENVLRNAVACSVAERGVDVVIGLESGQAGPVAAIRIRDFGPGVPEDQLGHLFEPFYRVEDSRDRQSGGVGLGLAIADRAVRAHGGSIEARNHPEGGLEVTIRLPESGES